MIKTIINYFNSTRFKVRTAHFIYLFLKMLCVRQTRIIHRNGICFAVDLAEGIDLSLFLFGSFQKHITDNVFFKLPDNAVIFDIGANIGSISLVLGNKYPQSIVYAFEPTDYAFEKLTKNIALNPAIKSRIIPEKMFISSHAATVCKQKDIFSSWPVDKIKIDGPGRNRHPVHLGSMMKSYAKQTTLDCFVKENNISRIDFIKIDTDGHEMEVFKGASDTLTSFRPVIIFELSTYLLQENNQNFSDFEQILLPAGYHLVDGKTGRKVRSSNINEIVPENGSTDIIAIPGTIQSTLNII